MKDATISDFLAMQHTIAVEKGWIKDRNPEKAPYSLLWSIDELGEAIAIIKKKGTGSIMNNPDVRAHFTEELADTFMYLFDMMECLVITGEEFTDSFIKKYEHNLGRKWTENAGMYEDTGIDRVFFGEGIYPSERLAELLIRSGAEVYFLSGKTDEAKLYSLFNDSAKVIMTDMIPDALSGKDYTVDDEPKLKALEKIFGI